ncbi:substrate-binding domain-containing protein [Undibacterium sp. TS12]|uniref:substrate-binding domain-containing protein n=1 Tax=Undibacterium sp. TS12 TaxID=2908202 RepID=UPI001F4C5A2F|nr:substrate-binding domain-containing protein [Undibacterium sp. TS12]MCH8623034.1 substrate-binding domain-containing protein [Undibacterium sp. TS12]
MSRFMSRFNSNIKITLLTLTAANLFAGGQAVAADIRVISSGGFAQAYKNLAPAYEQTSGDKLVSGWGPSMGTTTNAIPVRMARGEEIDVVIMVGDSLDALMKEGKLVAGSKVVLANSPIACAVKKGNAKPDISTVDGLKSAFLKARKVAYSDSASGEYIKHQLMKKLDIVEQMQDKTAQIPATPVGEIIAHGDADFGCQQRSELLPVEGIDIVGLLPPEVQLTTVFSAAIVNGSKVQSQAQALLNFLSSEKNAGAIADTGLEPVAGKK